MRSFRAVSQKLVLGLFLSILASSAFAAEKLCNAFYIQLFVTSSPAKANQMKSTFNRAGFSTAVLPYQSNGRTLYRVRTGPYDTRSAANQTQQTMKAALQGNSTAQSSIITAGTKQCGNAKQAPKQQKQDAVYLQNATQCYRDRSQSRTTAIQLTDKNGKVNGYYFSRPDETDGVYGYITGSRSNNTVKGKFHYTVEGDTGTQDIDYRLHKQQLLVDGQYRYQQVSCDSVKEEIDVAKNVEKELKDADQQQVTPEVDRTSLRFNQFKAPPAYTGKNHPLVMTEFGRQFRTRLGDAIKHQKPSFAGHYLVVGWGCGSSGCNTGAVINAKTGVATPFPVSIASVFPIKPKYKNEDGQEQIYQLNSRLMIFAGNLGTDQPNGSDRVEFYEFKNGKFTFLEFRPYGRSVND